MVDVGVWDSEGDFVTDLALEDFTIEQDGVEVTPSFMRLQGDPTPSITLDDLAALGYPDENIITTLELKMKCAVGKCGRCNIGPKYVCLDGPVFRLSELKELPAEY